MPSFSKAHLSISLLACTAMLAGCAVPQADMDAQSTPSPAIGDRAVPGMEATIHPEIWPTAQSPIAADQAMEARIAGLLQQMSLREKVGQVIQADIGSVTPAEVREYSLGSILNGGNSAPGGDNYAAPQDWLALADAFWDASTDTANGRTPIPVIWGTDAVHGHNNIIGATIFPHNIGLGAANNPALMEEIGQVTAREIRVTGLDWTFAPTIAVVRNDRWGRTYESYSEDPAIVRNYAPFLVYGLQGRPGDADFLTGEHLAATVKHFVGDGGTVDGVDQGENLMSEEDLRDLQAAGYASAVEAGVQSVMASFNSWHGKKMHGFKPMLTDVLRGRFNFDGVVVGDWNGHGQVAGCIATSCAQSMNAGLDLYMAPDSWKGLYESTLAQVRSGEIAMERLDEAVARVLRMKMRAGLFEAGRPSGRMLAGQWDLLGNDRHMDVARRAVRESMVLLKNNGVLPIKPGARVLITGEGADDIGKQSGGWTINWQGTGNTAANFPNGVSVYGALKEAIEAAGGTAVLASDPANAPAADVAIVVYGEDPYAEFQGDRDHVDFVPQDALAQLTTLKNAGTPTVSVFLSGRPMWINPELNRSDAFVAAWLPGTAAQGIADVMVADASGTTPHDFKGKLSFSWPNSANDVELNVGDANYSPLFPYGYGLSYAAPASVPSVSEDASLAGAVTRELKQLLLAGVAQAPWVMRVEDSVGEKTLPASFGTSSDGKVSVIAADDQTQEDMRLVKFSGPGSFVLATEPTDLEREANGDMAIRFSYRIDDASGDLLTFGGRCGGTLDCSGEIDMTAQFKQAEGKGWQTADILLGCLGDEGVYMGRLVSPFTLRSSGGFTVGLKDIALVENTGAASCEL